jgi:hydroxyethylthiazole kinase-like uncharacterized protein yjeF
MLPLDSFQKDELFKELGYSKDNQLYMPLRSHISAKIPKRAKFGSKYDHGTVTTVAGSTGMCGAASLASQSVLRAGAGMSYLIAPKSISDILQIKVTEPVILPAPEINGSLSLETVETVNSLSSKTDAMVIGPGLSRSSETLELVRQLCFNSTTPIVLDGDGLSAFVNQIDKFKKCKNLIITPHYGEWKKLFGELDIEPNLRADALREVAVAYGITILFKGYPTTIATPDDNVMIVPVGNSGMATAGSGDILTGIIAALLAQGLNLLDATVVGSSIHGEAGDIASQIVGEHSVVATDILENIGKSILSFRK